MQRQGEGRDWHRARGASLVSYIHSFLVVNLCYSNIKLSSPTINNVMIAGSIMMYFCVFLTSFDYGNLLSKAVDKNICMVGIS